MANKLREWATNPAISGEKIVIQLLRITSCYVDDMIQNIDDSDRFWKAADDATRTLNTCNDFISKFR